MSKLALKGGAPVRSKPFPPYNAISCEEKRAVLEVMESGELSGYLARFHPHFYGGKKVRELEENWAAYFNVKHAVTVNSATSGLYAAIGAAGVGPGDEVIVSPYTMTASVTCVLAFNAIPVFADIDERTFCLDPESITSRLTPRTKAIVVVHLFGHPADMDPIMNLAQRHNLVVIEDCAQSPGAAYKGRLTGSIAHMGVFSLNYHKIIHTGEGGVVTTNDDELAVRLQLIRNHGEVVAGDMGYQNIINIIGYNFRMTEIECAIGIEQLKKLGKLTDNRIELANYITEKLKNIDGIFLPAVLPDCRHVYYVYPVRYKEEITGLSRDLFIEAMAAEGIPLAKGYVKPIYLESLYQKLIAYGNKGCPFKCPLYKGEVNYQKGLCPVVERMYEKELFIADVCRAPLTREDADDFINALMKVLEHKSELM